jgi:hypothetical protein
MQWQEFVELQQCLIQWRHFFYFCAEICNFNLIPKKILTEEICYNVDKFISFNES